MEEGRGGGLKCFFFLWYPGRTEGSKPVPQAQVKATVLVTLDGTDLSTLPSQCWFTRLARKIPKNNIERGRGAGEGHFRLGCEVS